MFTRRQAIRWAELWVSCWNEGDYETLLALYRDTIRFGADPTNRFWLTTTESTPSNATGPPCPLAFIPFAASWSACPGIPRRAS